MMKKQASNNTANKCLVNLLVTIMRMAPANPGVFWHINTNNLLHPITQR